MWHKALTYLLYKSILYAYTETSHENICDIVERLHHKVGTTLSENYRTSAITPGSAIYWADLFILLICEIRHL